MHSIVPRQLSFISLRAFVLAVCATGLLAACNNSLDGAGATITTGTGSGNGTIGGNGTGSSSGGGPQSSYTIGGNVIGLSGTGLVLANNAGNNLAITGNGGFTFSNSAANGAPYAVTVQSQPVNPSQACTVMDGTGTVGTVNVASVVVSCTTNFYTVGGSVTGLVGTGLVLQTNGTNNVSVSSPGNYVFSTLASGSNYTVTVMTQPSSPAQTCTVANDTGKLSSANVTNVAITCTTNNYAISGSVSGLTGAGLVLQTNGGNAVSIAGSGSYTFATLPSGSSYAVTVLTQPANPSQTCTVGNGTGTVISADVTNVSVTCSTNLYSIGGTVTGLNGTALMLQDNGGDNLTVPASGSFRFATKIASNLTYAVTVGTEPTNPAQYCRVTNGTGTVTTANVTSVTIKCSNTGKFLFVTNPFDNFGNGSIAAFTINPVNGALTAAGASPYAPAELQPYALALDPGGQYLYVANSQSAIVSTDAIGANGALTLDVFNCEHRHADQFPVLPRAGSDRSVPLRRQRRHRERHAGGVFNQCRRADAGDGRAGKFHFPLRQRSVWAGAGYGQRAAVCRQLLRRLDGRLLGRRRRPVNRSTRLAVPVSGWQSRQSAVRHCRLSGWWLPVRHRRCGQYRHRVQLRRQRYAAARRELRRGRGTARGHDRSDRLVPLRFQQR